MNKRGVIELPWVFSLGSIYRYEVDEILGDAHIVEGAYLNERPDWPTAPTLFFFRLYSTLVLSFYFVFLCLLLLRSMCRSLRRKISWGYVPGPNLGLFHLDEVYGSIERDPPRSDKDLSMTLTSLDTCYRSLGRDPTRSDKDLLMIFTKSQHLLRISW